MLTLRSIEIIMLLLCSQPHNTNIVMKSIHHQTYKSHKIGIVVMAL